MLSKINLKKKVNKSVGQNVWLKFKNLCAKIFSFIIRSQFMLVSASDCREKYLYFDKNKFRLDAID
jgi:hypothetical protein